MRPPRYLTIVEARRRPSGGGGVLKVQKKQKKRIFVEIKKSSYIEGCCMSRKIEL